VTSSLLELLIATKKRKEFKKNGLWSDVAKIAEANRTQ